MLTRRRWHLLGRLLRCCGDEAAVCFAALARDRELQGALLPCALELARVFGGGGSGVGAAAEALLQLASTEAGLPVVTAAVTPQHLLAALAFEGDDSAVHAVVHLAHRLAGATSGAGFASVSVAVALVKLIAPTHEPGVRTRAAAALRVVAADDASKEAIVAAGYLGHIVSMLQAPTAAVRLPALHLLCAFAANSGNSGTPRHLLLCAAPIPNLLVSELASRAARGKAVAATTLRLLARKGRFYLDHGGSGSKQISCRSLFDRVLCRPGSCCTVALIGTCEWRRRE